ncbi:hypothetical protein [Sphingobium aquiterrae]|uniref:hypothetical protein n=1 Tax=Sphingobium aquiterrae TaxID=2038656 RepID=UPI003018F410
MMLRIVAGAGHATPCQILMTAIDVAREAKRRGIGVLSIRSSHSRGSSSRYVWMADKSGRRWLVRVSNHRRPPAPHKDMPNIELVTLDGVSGMPELCAWLDTIAAGDALWTDPVNHEARRKERREARRGRP